MNKRILIVEDNELVRTSFASLLRAEGYDVLLAENGREAIEILNDNPDQLPCLVITDFMMPEMNGRELIRILKKTDRLVSLPVVVQTLHQKPDLPDGVVYVKKALEVDRVLEYVREFCGRPDPEAAEATNELMAASEDGERGQ